MCWNMIAINYWQICKFASINYIFWAEQAAKFAKRDNFNKVILCYLEKQKCFVQPPSSFNMNLLFNNQYILLPHKYIYSNLY